MYINLNSINMELLIEILLFVSGLTGFAGALILLVMSLVLQ